MGANDRFYITYSQGNGFTQLMQVWVDKQTGVNYLFTHSGHAGGLTVLLGPDGKPVVTPMPRE